MSLLDDARRLLNEMGPDHQGMCLFCYGVEASGPNTPIEHQPGCVYLRRGRIVAALELIDRLGFTFEEQGDGLHVISRPKRRDLISERAVRVMEAAERMVVSLGGGVAGGFVAAYPDEQCWRCVICDVETPWVHEAVPATFYHESACAGQALVAELRGEGATA